MTDAAEAADPPMEEILVSGEFPGPGLWRVSKQAEDGEHVMWIFGTLGGAEPASLRWKSRQLEQVVTESQEIIHADQSNLSFDFGPFTALRHLPAALRARRNPDDKSLEEVLPADVYQRWRLLKAEYIGNDSGIEKWRPYMVADQLRKEVGRKMRPKFRGDQWARIDQLIREHELRVTTPMYEVKIPDRQLGRSMKTFLSTPLDDVQCLDVSMKLVEFWADEESLNARAMAWARANLPALRGLPPLPEPENLCMAALLESQAVQDLNLQGIDDPAGRRVHAWLGAVDRALAANRSTLAILPIDELLKQNGKLSLLRERGYRVEEPN
jgi:hypothetical protein